MRIQKPNVNVHAEEKKLEFDFNQKTFYSERQIFLNQKVVWPQVQNNLIGISSFQKNQKWVE